MFEEAARNRGGDADCNGMKDSVIDAVRAASVASAGRQFALSTGAPTMFSFAEIVKNWHLAGRCNCSISQEGSMAELPMLHVETDHIRQMLEHGWSVVGYSTVIMAMGGHDPLDSFTKGQRDRG
ncbi:hypothetical protein D3227_37165 [Mesorhizobium waimense]|uniref:Uncharacterized protein n=1 Tax=Mesorhizobium waimense TaxID=1300307 RepID=A0A3A5K2G5_9HYPH|nr:hypothetical protein D3227_37165 [Mesorhizobium waimense]